VRGNRAGRGSAWSPIADDNGDSDSATEQYLNFQSAKQTLNEIDSVDAFLPFRAVNLTTSCIGLAVALAWAASIELGEYERRHNPLYWSVFVDKLHFQHWKKPLRSMSWWLRSRRRER